MKIFSIDQIRAADLYTIEHEPIASIDLMERAALACVNWIAERYGTQTQFNIFCGSGNNGADGLAISRLLVERNYDVHVFIITHSEKGSKDFIVNYERLKLLKKNNLKIDKISDDDFLRNTLNIDSQSILIDAILGSGLNKPIDDLIAKVVHVINQQKLPVISIDIPSGLYCDHLNTPTDVIVNADFTLTFQFPKLSFMFPENSKFIGEFSILDIGIHPDHINHTQTQHFFIAENDIKLFLKIRNQIAHKGNFGHALIAAGSYGKMGAAVLAAKACMRAGVGLLTVHIPKSGYEILQTTVPEAMVDVDSEEFFISDNIHLEKYNAIGIGPGIGTEKQTQNVVKLMIQNAKVPLVIDADALNILSENKTWIAFIPANSIFTPHPKEFERIVGKFENSEERLKIQREFSIKNGVYVVLKGAHTSVSCPDGNVYFNSTGNPGMATAGSGDALTGIITSFIAQGYTPEKACVLGVYMHGLAGDFSAYKKTEESMIATDIIEHLSDAFKFLRT